MRKLKQTKGITLVALILTIVILLILAVVTINSIQGEGIIAKAMKAREDYEGAVDEEQGMLDEYLQDMEGISQGRSESGDTNNEEYTLGEKKDSNSTINGEQSSSTNPIIPAGFIAKNTKTSVWDGEDGPEVDKGLVITDGTNEFVWVPVTTEISAYNLGTTSYKEPDVVIGNGVQYDNDTSNLSIINNILGTSYASSSDFLADLQSDFNKMAESVNKNDGFYVGRYETSSSDAKKAQSVKNATSITSEADSSKEWQGTWYSLYAIEKAAYNNDSYSVQSTMIWASQYNAMMSWMGDAANTTISNKNTSRQTGIVETDKINNVYDLYGNCFEWTLEAKYIDVRVGRGGNSNYDETPSSYFFSGYPTSDSNNVGSRLALYIK